MRETSAKEEGGRIIRMSDERKDSKHRNKTALRVSITILTLAHKNKTSTCNES